jgi:hypothetical protein
MKKEAYKFEVTTAFVVRDAALATVRFWGKAKEFFRFQEEASRLVTVKKE